jgi:hypothetical protein
MDEPAHFSRYNDAVLAPERRDSEDRAVGPDGVRLRATNLSEFPDIPGALDAAPAATHATVSIGEYKGTLINGKLRAEVWANGTLHFFSCAPSMSSILTLTPQAVS